MNPLTILLTSEGTYPCYPGGVSVWCDNLIRHLPEVDFHVFAITHSPSRHSIFSIPENVVSSRTLPLWGTEEAGEFDNLFSQAYRRKMRTTAAVIHKSFRPSFQQTVHSLLHPDFAPELLARSLLHLHAYFREYDYAQTMTSPEAWEIFLSTCSHWLCAEGKVDLDEATSCMRVLQRYLAVLSVSYPRADITHASMAGLAGIPGVLAKLAYGSPFLLTEHGVYLRELYLNLGRTAYSVRLKRFLLSLNEAVVRMNYHYADAITSVCEFNKTWQSRIGADAAKIHVLPNGVDPAVFAPRAGPPRERPTVLTMARIYPLKGIDVLLRAAALVREQIPDVKFRILGEVGDGEYFKKCLQIVSENQLGDSVEFSRTDDSAAAYCQADVFCLPSISEAMPYSVLEAMLSGCPVVASEVGGVADLLGETGLLVKPKDEQALARSLLFLLEDGEAGEERRAILAQTALARARERFTLQRSIAGFREIYNYFVHQKDGSRRRSIQYQKSSAFSTA